MPRCLTAFTKRALITQHQRYTSILAVSLLCMRRLLHHVQEVQWYKRTGWYAEEAASVLQCSVCKLLSVWVRQTVCHQCHALSMYKSTFLLLYSIQMNVGQVSNVKWKVSEDSDSQQPCRKRLKCIAEAAVARRKLYFPAVAANSPSVTVSYIYACIAITCR